MGEVYKGRDTRLDRTVALKVLPGHIAHDATLRERLEREARAISRLDHPNICALYDIGHQDGVDFLVMQYLEGETLEARLRAGPLGLDLAVRYGIQIAAALDRAHRGGIIHRDLKPANVMLTPTGATLLDFGIAAVRSSPGGLIDGRPSVPESDQQTELREPAALTSNGMLLGTLPYMSPEQIEGKPADARSDIFSLGAVLYEMVTRRRAFDGQNPASVMTAILRDTPAPVRRGTPLAPAPLEQVIETCLAKDPEQRWQSAQDVQLQLLWIDKTLPSHTGAEEPTAGHRRGWRFLTWAAPALLVVTALAWLISGALSPPGEPVAEVPPTRTLIPAPDGVHFQFSGDFAGPPAFAPDGRRMAFVAADANGRSVLNIRQLDSLEFTPLAGTDGATFPFWSPDSRFIGFFADGALKKIDAAGGPAITLAAALNPRGGSWGTAGTIVYEPDSRSELMAVSASGGQPTPVTQVDRAKHTTHRWPYFLPDGRRFLFLAASHAAPASEHMGIHLGSIDGMPSQLLVRANANAAYASGYLLFTRERSLFAQAMDPASGALSGDAVAVSDVQVDVGTWRAVFDVSPGSLLYQAPAANGGGSRIQWFSRAGQPLSVLEQGAAVFGVRLSPDGTALAVPLGDPSGDIWIFNLANGTRRRLTFGTPIVNTPVWSPDASRMAFSSDRQGGAFVSMYVKQASGAGTEALLIESPLTQAPTDWSADGKFIAYNQYDPRGASHRDVFILDVASRTSHAFERTERGEADAQFSPDGKWVAYTLTMDREEIYVVPFRHPSKAGEPAVTGRWQVSLKGGRYARWRHDGRELFYLAPDGTLMVAEVDGTGSGFDVKAVRPLFKVSATPLTINQGFPYDVSSDGQRFVVNTAAPQPSPPVVLVSNWRGLVRR